MAGSIHEIKSAKEIVEEIVVGAVKTLDNINKIKRKVETARL